MQELNVLTVDTLEVDKISRVLAISKDEQVVAMEPSGISPDLSEYAKKSEVDNIAGDVARDLIDREVPNIKKWVEDQNYLSDQDLSEYAKISYVDAIVGNINAILESI